MKKSTKLLAAGAVSAAVAGYVAGILTAPKSGKETRADIKKNAQQLRLEAEKNLKRLHTELTATLETAKEKIKPLAGNSREQLQLAMDAAKISKDKAQKVLNAFSEGDTSDKDLSYAVKEAKQSLKHLKTFLAK